MERTLYALHASLAEKERERKRECVCAVYKENRPEDCNIANFFFFWHDLSFLLELITLKGNIS